MENKEPPRNLLSADIPYNDTKPIAGFGRPQPNLMMNPDTVSKIMRGIEIRPRLLEENARANMFPEVIHHIVVRSSTRAFTLHRPYCAPSTARCVRALPFFGLLAETLVFSVCSPRIGLYEAKDRGSDSV